MHKESIVLAETKNSFKTYAPSRSQLSLLKQKTVLRHIPFGYPPYGPYLQGIYELGSYLLFLQEQIEVISSTLNPYSCQVPNRTIAVWQLDRRPEFPCSSCRAAAARIPGRFNKYAGCSHSLTHELSLLSQAALLKVTVRRS